MASLTDIREQIAVSLKNNITDLQASAYLLSSPTPPAAEVIPGMDHPHRPLTQYDQAFQRGLDRRWLTVRVYVGIPTDIGAQKQLDAMLASAGVGSVKAAVEEDPTLDGTVENVRVVEVSGYRMYPFPNSSAPLLGAEWLVEVLARGDA